MDRPLIGNRSQKSTIPRKSGRVAIAEARQKYAEAKERLEKAHAEKNARRFGEIASQAEISGLHP
jgi:hypothetical protein